jgi:hypothetical protein
LGLVVVFYRWDKRDIRLIKLMKVKPHLRLKAVLNRHPHLYNLMADVEQPANEDKALVYSPNTNDSKEISLKERNPTFETEELVSPRPTDDLFRLSIDEILKKRKQQREQAEVFDRVTRRRQTILLDYGVHPRIVNQQWRRSDLTKASCTKYSSTPTPPPCEAY